MEGTVKPQLLLTRFVIFAQISAHLLLRLTTKSEPQRQTLIPDLITVLKS